MPRHDASPKTRRHGWRSSSPKTRASVQFAKSSLQNWPASAKPPRTSSARSVRRNHSWKRRARRAPSCGVSPSTPSSGSRASSARTSSPSQTMRRYIGNSNPLERKRSHYALTSTRLGCVSKSSRRRALVQERHRERPRVWNRWLASVTRSWAECRPRVRAPTFRARARRPPPRPAPRRRPENLSTRQRKNTRSRCRHPPATKCGRPSGSQLAIRSATRFRSISTASPVSSTTSRSQDASLCRPPL